MTIAWSTPNGGDTLTRTVRPVEPLVPGRVSMYSCGPTVYRWVHVGNLLSYLLADLIRRVLLYHGLEVRHVKNVTDVGHLRDERFDRGDDPMLVQAGLEDKTPGEIAWVRNAAGTNEQAVLFGDPSKPGPYVVRVKWLPGNMSRPHFHPNDRFITVISGTWWVGSGTKFDPNATVPMPAGTFVTHFGKQVHYDGAKEGDAILLIVGEGPATSTRAEEK